MTVILLVLFLLVSMSFAFWYLFKEFTYDESDIFSGEEPHRCAVCVHVINPGRFAKCKMSPDYAEDNYNYTSCYRHRQSKNYCKSFDLDMTKADKEPL